MTSPTPKEGRASILSREQVRAVDRMAIETYGIPGLILMENAGRGSAEVLIDKGVTTTNPVCVCCGKGNNGGDGFVLARHLQVHEIPVEVFLFTDPAELQGDAATNFQILTKTGIPIHHLNLPQEQAQLTHHLSRASWVVDALLGTGASGEVRDPFATVIDSINASGALVLSLDVPSGLDCDTGEHADKCVNATVTTTFVAAKPGFQKKCARERVGEVVVVSIGIPQAVLTAIRGGEEFNQSET